MIRHPQKDAASENVNRIVENPIWDATFPTIKTTGMILYQMQGFPTTDP